MNEEDMDEAHEVLEAYQEALVVVGRSMLQRLSVVQQEYVVRKLQDEFRFWRLV